MDRMPLTLPTLFFALTLHVGGGVVVGRCGENSIWRIYANRRDVATVDLQTLGRLVRRVQAQRGALTAVDAEHLCTSTSR